ncbi:MAG TPA: LysM peptidoglycan-binding domain-containing protein [Afifellaceae bacterium]|nr:LysM peptidoglycan-binding domain-containing protein [Afifellaceae bacterium]
MTRLVRAALRLAAVVWFAALAGGMLAAPAWAQSACGSSATIGPGDTLGRIAARCGTTLSALLQANPDITNPNNVFVGQVIRMPGAAAGGPSGPFFGPSGPHSFSPPPAFQAPAAEGSYVVRPGDTLASIADRLGIPLAQLISANPDADPRFIRPGMVLRVPAGVVLPRQPGPLPGFGPPRQEEASLFVEPGFARPGRDVELTALGLPPGSRARILGGMSPDDLTVIDRVSVDGRGRLRASVEVPDWARPGSPFYFAVETRWPPVQALAEPIRIGWVGRGPGRGRDRDLTVIGTLTREGVECPALRGDDGRLYTLAGDIRGFRPGDRIRVEGQPADFSTCMQGTTIEVSRIRPAD